MMSFRYLQRGGAKAVLTPGRCRAPARGIGQRSFNSARGALVHRSTIKILAATTTRFPPRPYGAARLFSSSGAVDDSPTTADEGFQTFQRKGMRNVAIIAHVDHGKTTLVDELLLAARRSHGSASEDESLSRLMDSGELEIERGITIKSKVTRVNFRNTSSGEDMVLNIVDTPGHSDFSGEVDRILSMVDGVCLVVDIVEGPMTQTKYVLSRALEAGLKPIVVLNKCDRPEAPQRLDTGDSESRILDLFGVLGASEDQMDYVTAYASAKAGWVVLEDPLQALDLAADGYEKKNDAEGEYAMSHLLQAIIDNIPQPSVRCYNTDMSAAAAESSEDGEAVPALEREAFAEDCFSMAVVSVGTDSYLGRTCTGRIVSGSVAIGDKVRLLPREPLPEGKAPPAPTSVGGIFCYEGVSRKPLDDERAFAGDCITLAGVPDSVAVGDTVTSDNNPVSRPIDTPPLAPPTLSVEFGANNGPFAGKEGTHVTSSKIRARLFAETDNNVTLIAEKSATDSEKTTVFARGELQLGVLVEQMRREGYELVLSAPRVLTWTDPETKTVYEPFEEVIIDVDAEHSGAVVSALTGPRKGVMMEMTDSGEGKVRLVFHVSSRGMLGFNSEIAVATKGSAIVNHLFLENREHLGALESSYGKSKLISKDTGKATAYAMASLADRGTMFIEPGDMVYSGMIVGENAKTGIDLEVNVVRQKEATNIRTHAKDEGIRLQPPRKLTLEEMIGYMAMDELIEVTPKAIRLRKNILDNRDRMNASRARNKQLKSMKK